MLNLSRNFHFLSLALILTILIILAGCSSAAAPSSSASNSSPLTTASEPAITSTTPASSTSTSEPVTTTTTTTASPPDAQEILDQAVNAWTKVMSYGYDINLTITMAGVNAGEDMNLGLAFSGNGSTNVTVHEMQLTGSMEIESGPGQGKISLPMDTYLVNGWQYMKVGMFGSAEWMKTRVEMNSYDASDDIQHIIDLAQSAGRITFLNTENVDGIACYVLQIVPGPDELAKWLKSALQITSILGTAPDIDFSKYVKSLAFKIWFAADGYLLKKNETLATVSMSGAELGGSAQAGDSMTMDLTETLSMTQYNQPVSIVLPPESQDAKDTSIQP
jgi:hypothetical protein